MGSIVSLDEYRACGAPAPTTTPRSSSFGARFANEARTLPRKSPLRRDRAPANGASEVENLRPQEQVGVELKCRRKALMSRLSAECSSALRLPGTEDDLRWREGKGLATTRAVANRPRTRWRRLPAGGAEGAGPRVSTNLPLPRSTDRAFT
jgi:hypothetical protein